MSVFTVLLRQSIGSRTLGLLLTALILAVTATTMLQFTTRTLLSAVQQQAGQLLAADIAITSTSPIQSAWNTRAFALKQSQVLAFSSMAQAGEQFALSSVKAVEPNFPLRGDLLIEQHGGGAILSHAPAQGTVWVEPRLLDVLHIAIGGSIRIGEANLQIAGVIRRDANRELGMNGFSPSIIMNRDDIAQAQIIQPGSRLEYRLLLAGPPDVVAHFIEENQRKLTSAERLRTAGQNNNRLNQPIRLLSDYAQVAGLLTIVLCGIAVALSARRFAAKQIDSLALIRCLGATRLQIWFAYLGVLLVVWCIAVLIGSGLGAFFAEGLLMMLRNTLPSLEINFQPLLFIKAPLLTGMLTATVTLLGFALPALLQMLRVSPLKVLRTDLGTSVFSVLGVNSRVWSSLLIFGLAWTALLWFVVLQTGKLWFSLIIIVAISVVFLVTFAIAWLVIITVKRSGRVESALLRQPATTALQIVSLAMGLGLIGVVMLLRGDLLNRWQTSLPLGTPNQFVYGLPPDQKDAFTAAIAQYHWVSTPLYPSVKGRLKSINNHELSSQLRRENRLERELNLTMTDQVPADNALVAGHSFSAPMQVSVEEKLAGKLGIHLGDRIEMSLPEGRLVATVVSLRSVDWDSFKPNFFFMYSKGSLDVNAGSYLGSFYLPKGDHQQLATVIQQFPTTMLIDIDAILQEIRHLLDMLGQALTLLASLVGLSGLLVLLASIHSTMDERKREAALLRTLGASKSQLRLRLMLELASLGFSAGLLAVVIAEVVGLVLAWRFDLAVGLHGVWWIIAPLFMMTITVMVGLSRVRSLWNTPPALILRELGV
ncbi:ABC transporter permease [Aquirhabdus sp.]|uniref:ABC transporter permease n=1 Tax=Aquirhabdus sp. TaxID=2824160 RepID=UPI00396C589D